MRILDVTSRSSDPLAKTLSNFTLRPFTLDDVACGSMEGFLQSVKFEDLELQKKVAELVGYQALKFGNTHGNGWKKIQTLWWRGVPLERQGMGYKNLLVRAYDAQYEQNFDLREALRDSVGQVLDHSMGKVDPTDTVLTKLEYIKQLNRLRERLLDAPS